MSQPAPRSNFIQTLLLFAVIYMGFLLIKGGFDKKPDPRTSVELITALRDLDSRAMDQTAMATKGVLLQKLDEEAKAGTIDAATRQARLLEGEALVAHAQYKGAVLKKDVNRIIPAYETLVHLKAEHGKSELWNQPITVQPHDSYPAFTETSLTFDSLTEKVEAEARALGRDTPVWGFFPGYQIVDGLVRMTGAVPSFSYAFAALVLALIVRALVFPLSQRQMMWSRQMAQLSPLVNEIKEQYKKKHGDRPTQQQQQELNAKLMGLYQEYGINPVAGCLPALLQMPLFLIIYQSMLHYRFEFRNGTFLWINQGSHDAFNIIGANLGEKDYILIVVYGISFIISTLLTPVSDPANARQQRVMGISISVFFAVLMFFWPVPSAFVLYWVFTNVFTTAQTLRAYRLPLPPLMKKNSPAGGVYPGTVISNGATGSTGTPKKHRPKKKK